MNETHETVENPGGGPESALPPSTLWLLLEGRALGELATTWMVMPALRRAPRGDGHPVLVLPGFLASDTSTRPLRGFLKKLGYWAHGWKLGRNLGPRPGVEEAMQERLAALHERHGRTVSLVGWSLGGVYARELARQMPEAVRLVISMGSPFTHHPKANHAWRVYEKVTGTTVDELDARFVELQQTPPVPTTSIYSRTDGIATWQCCVEKEGPTSENIEVPGSHLGLGFNPLVLWAVADRLAQPEGHWRRFDLAGARRWLYAKPRPHETDGAEAGAASAG
jgi:pimeloyl-ACP methyl ester carboxylesterase